MERNRQIRTLPHYRVFHLVFALRKNFYSPPTQFSILNIPTGGIKTNISTVLDDCFLLSRLLLSLGNVQTFFGVFAMKLTKMKRKRKKRIKTCPSSGTINTTQINRMQSECRKSFKICFHSAFISY